MLEESRIRKHLADVQQGLREKCDCAERGHTNKCIMGAMAMRATEEVLLWVLGENGRYDRLEEGLSARCQRGQDALPYCNRRKRSS
jgi:hypothetical protein